MSRVLRWLIAALIWTVFSGLAAYLYSPIETVIWLAAVGGGAGSLIGAKLGESRLRLPSLFAIAVLAYLATLALVWGLRFFDLGSNLMGPREAYIASEALRWLLQTLALSAALRASSVRVPSLVVLEGVLMASLLARLFIGHRDGNINRPFFLVDRLWSGGYDPLPVFLAIGAALAVLIVVLANSGGQRRGALRDTVVAVLLIGGLFVVAPVRTLNDLPKPPKLKTENGDKVGDLEQRYSDKDSPDFGDRKRGGQNSPVAVVVFEDNYTPPGEIFYFRQKAYSLYDGKRIVVDPSGKFDRDVPDELPTDTVRPEQEPRPDLHTQPLDMTISMMTEYPTPMGLVDATEFRPATNPDPIRFRNSYSVHSEGPLGEPVFDLLDKPARDSTWDEATRQHYLNIPDDPRYRKLADEIAAKVPSNIRDVPLIVTLFTREWLEDNLTYCLKTKHAGADDPVSSYLFGDRTGYCVYSANAACFLYRAQGVPARVVGGFAVPSTNLGNGAALLVGGSYAHAWPEIYIEGAGWLPLDVNPKKTLEAAVPPPDESLQQLLGEMARKKGQKDPAGDRPKKNLQDMARRGLVSGLKALPWLLLTAFLYLQVAKTRQRFMALRGKPDRLPVLTYRGVLHRLAEIGLVRGVGETRGEFARRVGQRSPAFSDLTQIHLENTLGHGRRRSSPEQLRQLYEKAVAELNAGRPATRKLLAWLDPISWLKAR